MYAAATIRETDAPAGEPAGPQPPAAARAVSAPYSTSAARGWWLALGSASLLGSILAGGAAFLWRLESAANLAIFLAIPAWSMLCWKLRGWIASTISVLFGAGLAALALHTNPVPGRWALAGMVLYPPLMGAFGALLAAGGATSRRVKSLEEQIAADHARIEVERRTNEFSAHLLNVVAHELNTPLNTLSIQLYLLRDSPRLSVAERDDSLAVMSRTVNRLGDLVRSTLDIARIRSGKLTLTVAPAKLGTIVSDVWEQLAPLATQKGVHVEVDTLAHHEALLDAGRLTQVIWNLVSNAIKFTPQGGEVKVRVYAEDGELICTVKDTGPGLTPAQRRRLFLPFSQVHPATDGERGLGLGLSISRGIVEAHGGEIWAESEGPGRGSEFGFAIPVEVRKRGPGSDPVVIA
jgi:signal transduction histidine kinase